MNRDPAKTIQRIILDVLLVAVFAGAAFDALDFRQVARYFPLTVSVVGFLASSLVLIVDLKRLRAGENVVVPAFDTLTLEHPDRINAPTSTSIKLNNNRIVTPKTSADGPWSSSIKAIMYLGSIALYALAISVIGMKVASFLYVFGFVAAAARWSWWKAMALGLCVTLGLFLLERFIGIRLPPGVYLS